MNYTEEAVLFSCDGETLAGIVCKPERPRHEGVVIIVGGPQYRAGSHRQFVLLSRKLAAAGFPVLRFDYRGMGDSEGDPRSFQSVSADIEAATSALFQHLPTLQHVALWGLCDGASAALLYCHETNDPRVNGLCLLNPWVRSETGLARVEVKNYYSQRLMQQDFWIKLMSGNIPVSALMGLSKKLRLTVLGAIRPVIEMESFQHRMAEAWNSFPGRLLLVLSGEDYVAKEFLESTNTNPVWRDALGHEGLVRYDLPLADHTFSKGQNQTMVENLTLDWLMQQLSSDAPVMERSLA